MLHGVCRIQLLRGIPAELCVGDTLSVDITCMNEFNLPQYAHTTGSADLKYQACLYFVDESGKKCIDHCDFFYSGAPQSTTTRLCFNVPSEVGVYALDLSATNVSDNILVLRLETEPFHAVQTGKCRKGGYVPRLLCSYRSVTCGDAEVKIKEEYGATIGSHVYDSSIIMLRYIENIKMLPNEAMPVVDKGCYRVLELGAGCGPFGLGLAAYLSKRLDKQTHRLHEHNQPNTSRYDILLTDKAVQLPLLSENIQLNQHMVHPSCVSLRCSALDWASETDIKKQIDAFNDNAINFIAAGDVFYDRGLVELFKQLVQRLSTPGVTVILVAQKLRENAQGEAVALINEEEIRSIFTFCSVELVRQEANVLIWYMVVIQ